MAGAILEDPEGGGVTGDRSPVLGSGVDKQLSGPQVHAVQVNLGRRTVAELEVEGGLLDLEGRLTGPGRVAGGDRPDQGVQGPGHLAGQQPRDAAPPGALPGRGHGVDPRGGSGPSSGADGVEAGPGAGGQGGQLGRQGPAEGVGGDGQGDRLEVAAAEGGIGCATQQWAEYRG
jgi:hypothetical protein